ncbi:hypothetical protein CLAFUW4_04486 [Fulvia fulva]|uniref:Uncharacterized protein n=1 Tax=Passalora fulva TaxID=5499 RepID=A0A9Q8P7G6_PASFU|nr:uncharacterized protein CLAFUR5_04451 [Fulvia fulva]KAK4626320.1 hypothetical protein CLAFUR4_04472 [Fulvia fulva]KAK4628294.1 hypothetical protein CLAFUR0_04475 [Fulvia fulva]UJO16125.1 hypothetical protein CLAFUR5_04451 [Fulvia fulva]WPV13220.1 hypothetical protein CLAFUW4_04486 [Fulvia fulva]WPV28610.1 hypothetical protein CLAFUW7_04478 [Fulvia fulva]
MRSQLFLSWLAIVSIVTAQISRFDEETPDGIEDQPAVRHALADEDGDIPAFSDDQEIDTSLDGYDHESVARDLRENNRAKRAPLDIRDTLADEAINMIHEYGQGVDVSLDGYDHDAVARDVEDGPLENVERGLGFEAARRLGRMKPHYVQHGERDEEVEIDEDGEDDGPWVDLDAYDEGDVEERDADDEDVGDGLKDEGDTPLVTFERDVEDEDPGDGLDDEGDTPLVTLERDVEDEGDDAHDDIDTSLEGYDHSLLDRDSSYEYYDPDEAFHDGAYDSGDAELGSEQVEEQDEEQDAAEQERVVQKGPPTMRRRGLVDGDQEAEEEDDDAGLWSAWSTVRRWVDDLMDG